MAATQAQFLKKSGEPGAKDEPMTGGATVTVACKLPHGIWLRIFRRKTTKESTPQGFRDVDIMEELPQRVRVNGWAVAQNKAPPHPVVGGYALTPGIPKEFWETWLEQNRTSDIVQNKIIYAHVEESSVTSQAVDQEKVRSGLERLDPDNLPKGIQRAPKRDGETRI
jgi:hypothetical protein